MTSLCKGGNEPPGSLKANLLVIYIYIYIYIYTGRRKNNAGTDKEEEKKLAEPLTKELPAEGCSRRNDKQEEGTRQK